MTIYLVIEDTGFYTEGDWPPYILTEDINSVTHSIVHCAFFDKQLAEKSLTDISNTEAEEWEVVPETKIVTAAGTGDNIKGKYVLGSFYYIQEVELYN